MNKLLFFKKHEVVDKTGKSSESLAKDDISPSVNLSDVKVSQTPSVKSVSSSQQSDINLEHSNEVDKALEDKRDQLRRQRSHSRRMMSRGASVTTVETKKTGSLLSPVLHIEYCVLFV